MKKALILGGAALAALCLTAAPAMAGGAGEVPLPLQIWGLRFSHHTVVILAAAAILIYLVVRLCTAKLSKDNPGRGQIIIEQFVAFFDDLTRQSLGPNRGRKYLPYIGTLFMTVWTCNMMGLIPLPQFHVAGESFQDCDRNGSYSPGEPFVDQNGNGRQDPGFTMPKFEEPTSNLNVPLGLALLFVVIIGHGSEIYIHGILGYLKSYFSPGGMIGLCMFPLNVVGKCAEVVSVSFRLFGNIFGGVIIISIISGLLYNMLLPIGMFGYFGVFVGTVQAFVFTMLALTYISSGAAEEQT